MKVIFVLPDMGSGGAERVVSMLSSQLSKLHYAVEICMLFGNKCLYDIDNSVKITKLKLLDKSKLSRISILRNYLVHVSKQNQKVTTIVFQDSCLNYVLAAAVGTKVKVIASERSNPYRKGKFLFKRILSSIPYMLCDRLVFQTYDARKYYLFLLDSHTFIISNPINKSAIRWNGDLSPNNLISVCRLHLKKNIEMTLLGIKQLKNKYPNIHLNIYGEGDWKANLLRLISENNLENNVTLCGVTKDVLYKLADSSIYLSTSDEEGISNSMLEAMSIGMPIICTDCPIGGAKMMLSEGAGVLVPVGDINKFSQALDRLLSDFNYAKKIAKEAHLRTLQYTPEQITNLWERVLKTL